MKKKEAIAIDMDGTILESKKAHITAYKKALKEGNYPKKTSQEIQKELGKPHKEVAKKLLPKQTTEEEMEIFEEKKTNYFEKEGMKNIKAKPYAKEILKKLKKNYKIILISNCSRKIINHALKEAKISQRIFDDIIDRTMVKKSKPSPEGIKKGEKKGRKKIKYMIGDTIYDIIAARRAGEKRIAIIGGWHTKEQLKKEQPTIILASIKQLKELL